MHSFGIINIEPFVVHFNQQIRQSVTTNEHASKGGLLITNRSWERHALHYSNVGCKLNYESSDLNKWR